MNISNNSKLIFNQTFQFVINQKNNLTKYTVSLLKNCQSYPSLAIKLIAINAFAVFPTALLVQTTLDTCINKLSEGKLKNRLEAYSVKIVNIFALTLAAAVTVVATSLLKLPLPQKHTAALSLLTNIATISLYTLAS